MYSKLNLFTSMTCKCMVKVFFYLNLICNLQQVHTSEIYNQLKNHQRIIPVLHNLLPSHAAEFYEKLLCKSISPFTEYASSSSYLSSSSSSSIYSSTSSTSASSSTSIVDRNLNSYSTSSSSSLSSVGFTVSLRNDYAMDTIRTLKTIDEQLMRETDSSSSSQLQQSARYHRLLLGSSTVRTVEQVEQLKALHIDFLSTISYSGVIVRAALTHRLPLICGVCNYTDVVSLSQTISTSLSSSPSSNTSNQKVEEITTSATSLSSTPSVVDQRTCLTDTGLVKLTSSSSSSGLKYSQGGNYVHGIKFYPATSISPQTLRDILVRLGLTHSLPVLLTDCSSSESEGDSEGGGSAYDDTFNTITSTATTTAADTNNTTNTSGSSTSTVTSVSAAMGSECTTGTHPLRDVIVVVAGGVTPAMVPRYLRAGATHFCVGFDCSVLTADQVSDQIREYIAAVSSAYRDSTQLIPAASGSS